MRFALLAFCLVSTLIVGCGAGGEGASAGGPALSDEAGHQKIMAIWTAGNELKSKKDFAAAAAKYREAIPHAETCMKGVFLPNAHNQVVDALEAAGKKDEALAQAKLGLEAARKLGKADAVKPFEERIAPLAGK